MSINKINEAAIEYANMIVKDHVSKFLNEFMEEENISSETTIQELLERLDLSNNPQKINTSIKKNETKGKKKKLEDSANESISSNEREASASRPVSGCTYMFKKGAKKNTYCKKKVLKDQWVCSTHSSKKPIKEIKPIPEEDIKVNDNHSEDWEEKVTEKRKIMTSQVDELLEKDLESEIEDQYLLYENNSECDESE